MKRARSRFIAERTATLEHPPLSNVREFEICVETLQACKAARDGGADRIELCAALSEGGVTPSTGMLRASLATGGPPVHVLLRPRAGNFFYSEAEFGAICHDAQAALDLGAAGIVAGCLDSSGEVHQRRMGKLVQLAAGKPVTFHRAFDHTGDLLRALEAVVASGCHRVLTSGGKPTVKEGFEMLRRLAEQAAGRIRIAAGGGVTLENAPELCRVPGLDLHASLRSAPVTPESAGDVLWQQQDSAFGTISVERVRRLRDIVHRAAAHDLG